MMLAHNKNKVNKCEQQGSNHFGHPSHKQYAYSVKLSSKVEAAASWLIIGARPLLGISRCT